MLLFNKICSIAHVLRLLYVLPETGRKFNIYMNVHFKFYTQGITVWKYKINFFGKSQGYNKTMSRQEKHQQNET